MAPRSSSTNCRTRPSRVAADCVAEPNRPGSSSSVTIASWQRSIIQSIMDTIIRMSMSVGTSPRSMPNWTNSCVPYGCSRSRNSALCGRSWRLAPELQAGAVVSEQGHPVREPVVVDEVRGAGDPVADDREEPLGDDLGRRVQGAGERARRGLVGGQEQPGPAAEVAEHRPLRDLRLGRDLLDPYAGVAALGELAHRGGHDPLPPGLLTRGRPHG